MQDRCFSCPRRCGVRRLKGERGICGADSTVLVGSAHLHQWEEPVLSGSRGAGAVFFSGCPLRCVYCQNYEISRSMQGRPVSPQVLAEMFLALEERGAHVLDLVTGTPYLDQIAAALSLARRQGLTIPVVWNTSGYETVESLRKLEGLVNVYLPDFKYWEEETAVRYSSAPGYRRTAKMALAEMVRQQPRCVLDGEDILSRGVLVRHLLLPGRRREAERILHWLQQMYGSSVWVSLMRQYTPVPGLERFPELQRPVGEEEYAKAASFAESLQFERLFLQEKGCADRSYIPDFGTISG